MDPIGFKEQQIYFSVLSKMSRMLRGTVGKVLPENPAGLVILFIVNCDLHNYQHPDKKGVYLRGPQVVAPLGKIVFVLLQILHVEVQLR